MDLLNDARVQNLLKEERSSGFALYILILLHLECRCENGAARYAALLLLLAPYASKNQIDRVLTKYNLFEQDENLLFHARAHATAHTPAHEPAHAGDTFPVEKEENRERIASSFDDEEFRDFLEMPYFRFVYPLIQENRHALWWENACLKAMGWSSLLHKHRREAILYYMRHLAAFGYEDKIKNMEEAKRHFTLMITHAVTGKDMKEYLMNL